MTLTGTTQKCPYFPHLGPAGCLPAPNIFPLAKETFAKGKMFWNLTAHVTQQLALKGSYTSRCGLGVLALRETNVLLPHKENPYTNKIKKKLAGMSPRICQTLHDALHAHSKIRIYCSQGASII